MAREMTDDQVNTSPTSHQHQRHRPTSNIQLFGWGVLLALISALYPHLPAYLPSSVSDHLPFLTPSLRHPQAQPWQNLQRYQHKVPIAANHDPFDVEGQEEEKRLRMGSKEGKKQKENELRKIRHEIERRTERAGVENRVHEDLPVYYLRDDPSSISSSVLRSLSDEILDTVRPKSVIFLTAVDSSNSHVQVFTAPSFTSQASSSNVEGNPSLARHLITTFAHAAPSVLALPTPSTTLPDGVSLVYDSLFGQQGARVNIVIVGIPVPLSNTDKGKAWDIEEVYDVGHALLRTRREEDDVVVIALGGTLEPSSNPSSSFPALLHDALAHHTSHPRLTSLASLYAGASGTKPTTRQVKRALVGVYAAVGAAGEGEGQALDVGGKHEGGEVWRFGLLPMRKSE